MTRPFWRARSRGACGTRSEPKCPSGRRGGKRGRNRAESCFCFVLALGLLAASQLSNRVNFCSESYSPTQLLTSTVDLTSEWQRRPERRAILNLARLLGLAHHHGRAHKMIELVIALCVISPCLSL